jgi:hypothetical protein
MYGENEEGEEDGEDGEDTFDYKDDDGDGEDYGDEDDEDEDEDEDNDEQQDIAKMVHRSKRTSVAPRYGQAKVTSVEFTRPASPLQDVDLSPMPLPLPPALQHKRRQSHLPHMTLLGGIGLPRSVPLTSAEISALDPELPRVGNVAMAALHQAKAEEVRRTKLGGATLVGKRVDVRGRDVGGNDVSGNDMRIQGEVQLESGTICEYNELHNEHLIMYDSGDQDWQDLLLCDCVVRVVTPRRDQQSMVATRILYKAGEAVLFHCPETRNTQLGVVVDDLRDHTRGDACARRSNNTAYFRVKYKVRGVGAAIVVPGGEGEGEGGGGGGGGGTPRTAIKMKAKGRSNLMGASQRRSEEAEEKREALAMKRLKMARKMKKVLGEGPYEDALVAEMDMDYPDVWQSRKMKEVFHKLNNLGKIQALEKWRLFIEASRRHERRVNAATLVQTHFRMRKAREAAARRRAIVRNAARVAVEQRLASRRHAELAKKKSDFEALKRAQGYSVDNVHFFFSKRELNVFVDGRQKAMRAFIKLARNKMLGLQALAMELWITNFEEAVMVRKEQQVRGITAVAAEIAHRQAIKVEVTRAVAVGEDGHGHPWHAAVGMKLKTLGDPGSRTLSDGSVDLYDLTRYNAFRAAHMGPYDRSNWVISNNKMLLMGGFPQGDARLGAHEIHAHGDAVATILNAGINVYICVMTARERADHAERYHEGVEFTEVLRKRSNDMANELHGTVVAAETRANITRRQTKLAVENAYHQREIDRLASKQKVAEAALDKTKQKLAKFPTDLHVINFEVEPQCAPEVEELLRVIEEAERFLRGGDRVYVFSSSGHGRAAVVATCILARLYGMTAATALERISRCHATRGEVRRMKERKGSKYKPIACPETAAQRMMVREALARQDEVYRSVVRKDRMGVVDQRDKRRAAAAILVNDGYVAADLTYARAEMPDSDDQEEFGEGGGEYGETQGEYDENGEWVPFIEAPEGRRDAQRHAFYGNDVDGGEGGEGGVDEYGALGKDLKAWTCAYCKFENRVDPTFCGVCKESRYVDDEG